MCWEVTKNAIFCSQTDISHPLKDLQCFLSIPWFEYLPFTSNYKHTTLGPASGFTGGLLWGEVKVAAKPPLLSVFQIIPISITFIPSFLALNIAVGSILILFKSCIWLWGLHLLYFINRSSVSDCGVHYMVSMCHWYWILPFKVFCISVVSAALILLPTNRR